MNKEDTIKIFRKTIQVKYSQNKLNNKFLKLLLLFIFFNLFSFASFGIDLNFNEECCELSINADIVTSPSELLKKMDTKGINKESVEILNADVKQLGGGCLALFKKLNCLILSKNVEDVENAGMFHCKNLQCIKVSKDNKKYCVISNSLFEKTIDEETGELWYKLVHLLSEKKIKIPKDDDESIMPDSVKELYYHNSYMGK